jgi:arylsulfatase A-like enzyme
MTRFWAATALRWPTHPDSTDWARYYHHMRLLDEQIDAKLRDLEQDGLADNTIVFY